MAIGEDLGVNLRVWGKLGWTFTVVPVLRQGDTVFVSHMVACSKKKGISGGIETL